MARPLRSDVPPLTERFEELYQQYAGQVFAWASRYAGGRSGWAQDVVHDVFVRAWKHRQELRDADVRAWLFRVTQNRAFSLLSRERTAGRLRQAVQLLWHAERPRTPEDALDTQRSATAATAALQGLPGQERVVLGLKILDGLSQREIASLLSLSEGYVSKLVARGTSRLAAAGWSMGRRDDGDRPGSGRGAS
jgi:RNA polymerase sigma factor (sigma-70 family)